MILKEDLTEFEQDHIDLDESYTLYSVTPQVKKFLLLYFVIGKVLLTRLLLHPTGFGVKLSKKSLNNLKIVASVLYSR